MNPVAGLVLAGGRGTRLWPATLGTSKQLLPVAGRPMIYFPIATLMLAGIRDITLVTSPQSDVALKNLLGSGEQFGVEFHYILQEEPEGIAHGFGLAHERNAETMTLAILGDNFFFGRGLGKSLASLTAHSSKTTIFVKRVSDAKPFGVATLDVTGGISSLEEKPQNPSSNLAVTGLYLFKPMDLLLPKRLKKSGRGEFEIVDLLMEICEKDGLQAEELSMSTFWSDLGNLDTLSHVDQYVRSIEKTQSMHVLTPELIAVEQGFVGINQMISWLESCPDSVYRETVLSRLKQKLEFDE